MKLEELRQLSVEDLKLRLEDAQMELANLQFQHSTHQLDNPMKIRSTRKEIARLRTLVREVELGIRK